MIDGEAEIGDQAAQQVEQARLHRDVEAAGRLVHEDQARPGDEVAGDLQALAHAAGEGARLVVDAVGVDLDAAEPVERRGADAAVVAVADRHQPLADIGAGRDASCAGRRRGFWCTKPQSVRIRKRRSASLMR